MSLSGTRRTRREFLRTAAAVGGGAVRSDVRRAGRRRPLKWDPVKELFVGDDEANRWLDRPKREPWRI